MSSIGMSMANNTTIITAPVKRNITPAELWIHLTIFYAFLCGVVSTIGNVLIIIGIARSKKLRNRFFVTVGSLTVCRVLLCLQFLAMAIYRMLRETKVAPSDLSRLVCHSVHFWLMIGLTLEMLLLLILVLDRAAAIIATTFYRNLTVRQAVIMCIATWVVCIIIKLSPSYTGVSLRQVVSCKNSYSAPSEIFNSYTQNIDLVLLCVILIVYTYLLIHIQLRVRALRASTVTSNAAMVSLKRQLRLMPMLRNLVVAHCSLALMSKILRTLAGVYPPESEASARFTAYGGVFSTLDLFSNMVALLWSNNDIRVASLPWFPCLHKKGAVTDAGLTQMPTQNPGQAPIKAWGTTNNKIGPTTMLTRVG